MALTNQSTLTDVLSEMYLLRQEINALREETASVLRTTPAMSQVLAEVQTLTHNVTLQAEAIENRITLREEKHALLEAALAVVDARRLAKMDAVPIEEVPVEDVKI